MTRAVSELKAIQFQLREKLLGRIALRSGLPRTPDSSWVSPEHRFYRMIVRAHYPSSSILFSRVIDVGCRNGSYLPELKRLFPGASVLGVELDASRRYWNLFRRKDYAQAYAQSCGAEVVFGDFLKLSSKDLTLPEQGKVLITHFFPFVSENPCLKWGLPAAYSDFKNQIVKMKSLQTSDLQIEVITAHQGEWEAEAVRSLPGVRDEKIFQPTAFRDLWPSPFAVHSFRIII